MASRNKGIAPAGYGDQLSMGLRSYQSLESGEAKLDIERLERIAEILETSMEELLRQDGYYIHQEIKKGGNGPGVNFGNYHYGIEEEMLSRLLATKDEEIKYLKEKIDQLMEMMGKKDNV